VRSQYSLISKQFTDRFSELSKRHEELNIFINQGPKHEAIFNDLSVKFNLQLASYVSKADLQQALSRNLSESSLLF
jgi:ABC-type branched-subunit amino acid transport system ATPase component